MAGLSKKALKVIEAGDPGEGGFFDAGDDVALGHKPIVQPMSLDARMIRHLVV